MVRLWRSLILVAFCLLAAGCDRASKSSSLRFKVPNQVLASKSVGAFAAMPTDRVPCYGVNIKGVESPLIPDQCSPPAGKRVGFVAAGKEIETTVPRGATITVELFLYLQPVGQNLACPVFETNVTNERLANLYVVGKSEPVTIAADENVIDIVATFPGLAVNLAQAMPAVCRSVAGSGGFEPFSVSSGMQTVTGTNMKVRATAGPSGNRAVLTGTNVKVIVR